MEEETMYAANNIDVIGTGSRAATGRNAISFGSQMLAVGAGFCVFIVLLTLFAAIQHRKRRRGSSLRSPLLMHKSNSAFGGHRQMPPSQAIPLPPPQYLRCSNQNLRKCSSPGGSDYSLSSSYSSSAVSTHSLSPMSPYGGGGGYQHHLLQQHPPHQQIGMANPFAGINFIPYGNNRTNAEFGNNNIQTTAAEKRRSFTTTTAALIGGGGIPELIIDEERGRGSISLQLGYDQNNLALQITVLACNGLPKFAGINNHPLNPYIKIRLLPEGQHRVKTRILRDTRDPIFDEVFTMYGINAEAIRGSQLHLAAMAFDRYNGDTVLGEVIYDLAEFFPGAAIEPQNVSLKWESRAPFEGQKRGKALVGMQFEQENRSIKFVLLKMADLPKDGILGLLDPYAKIYALVNGQKRIAKHKTRVHKRTQSPHFNSPEDWLEFTLPENVGFDPDGVPSALSFQVVLFNHDGVKRNEPIGQFTVDAESKQFTAAFQEGTTANENAEWHIIYPF